MNSGAGGSGRPTATANAPHAGAAGPNAAAMHRGKSAGPRTSEGLAQRRTARIDQWLAAAAITRGYVLRSVDRHGRIGESISGQAILDLVAEYARIKPHDLRRRCAKLC